MLEIIKWVAIIIGFPILLVSVFAYTVLLVRFTLKAVDEIEEKWDDYWYESKLRKEQLEREKERVQKDVESAKRGAVVRGN